MRRSGFRVPATWRHAFDGAKPSKYGNVRCTCDHNHKHDSRVESRFCDYLHLLQRGNVAIWGGRIIKIESQVTVDLEVCKYKSDFMITLCAEDGVEQVRHLDVKGFSTDVFRIKRKLFDRLFSATPLIVVRFVRGHWIYS